MVALWLVLGLLASSCAGWLNEEEFHEASVTIRNQSRSAVKINSYEWEMIEVVVPAGGEITRDIRWREDEVTMNFTASDPGATYSVATAQCKAWQSRNPRLVVWDGSALRCEGGWTGTSTVAAAPAATPTATRTARPTPTTAATVAAATATSGAATGAPAPPAATTRPPTAVPTTAPTVAPTVAPTAAPTVAPTPTVNPVRTVTLANNASENTHLFGPGEWFPCCRVSPGANRTLSFNSVTTPSVQFQAGRSSAILPNGTITCTFGTGTAPRVVYTTSGLRCQGW